MVRIVLRNRSVPSTIRLKEMPRLKVEQFRRYISSISVPFWHAIQNVLFHVWKIRDFMSQDSRAESAEYSRAMGIFQG
jgi:hypothetical protein